MFSSRARGVKIACLAAAVLALCLYAAVAGPAHMQVFYVFEEDPRLYDGYPLNISIERVLDLEGEDILLRSGPTIERLRVPGGPPPEVTRGAWISAKGLYRAGGWVEIQGPIYVHRLRKLKQAASTAGMLGLFACFFASYRWNREKRVFEERGPCRT